MKRIRKWKAFLIFVSSCFSCLLISGSAAVGGNIPEPGEPECVPIPGISYCGSTGQGNTGNNGGGGGGGLFNLINSWQEKAEERRRAEEQQRKQEAYNLNEQGNRAYEKKDWKTALDFYEKALKKSPDDKVIQQNLKYAQQGKNREDEFRQEQDEHRKKAEKLTALMPVVRSMPRSDPGLSGHARSKVPLPGFSAAQWKEYLEAQDLAYRLYAKLNTEGALSDADSREFYAALRRRNELWTMATEQPLTSEERDRLRLFLPVVVNKAIMDLTLIMQGIQPNSQDNISKPESVRSVISPDRRKGPAADSRSSESDAITNAFVADFFTDKITKLSENEVGSTIENVHGEKMKDRYENLIGVGKIAVKSIKGGRSEAGAETADLIISKIPNQTVSARAEHAVEGGRMYSNVACRTLNRFMVDAMNATGNSFDTEAFWKRFNEDRTESQKGVKKWIQFCE